MRGTRRSCRRAFPKRDKHMADKRDYYEVLGVAKGASEDEIKKQGRWQRSIIPTRTRTTKSAEAKFKEINEAIPSSRTRRSGRSTTSTATRASIPISARAAAFRASAAGWTSISTTSSAASSAAGFLRAVGPRPMRRRGATTSARGSLSASRRRRSAVRRRFLSSARRNARPAAAAARRRAAKPETCPTCGGSGQVRVNQRTPFGVMQSVRPATPAAARATSRTPRPDCRGNGCAQEKRRWRFPSPPASTTGSAFR